MPLLSADDTPCAASRLFRRRSNRHSASAVRFDYLARLTSPQHFVAKRLVSRTMSVISILASGGEGAILKRLFVCVAACPNRPVTCTTSLMSAYRSLVMSAAQALVPQLTVGFVPLVPSPASGPPSPSESRRAAPRPESPPLGRAGLARPTNRP